MNLPETVLEELSQKAYIDGRYDDMYSIFDLMQKDPSTRKRGRILEASYLAELGYHDTVLHLLEDVLFEDPKYTPALHLKGILYSEVYNNPNESRENFEKALRLEPENLELKKDYAELLFSISELNLAIEQLEYILERDPEDYNAMRLYCFSHAYNGNSSMVDSLENILHYNPQDIDALESLRVLYFQIGNYERGIELTNEILVYTDDLEDKINLLMDKGNNLIENDQFERGIETLKYVSNLTLRIESLLEIAIAYANQGDIENAAEYFIEGLTRNVSEVKKGGINQDLKEFSDEVWNFFYDNQYKLNELGITIVFDENTNQITSLTDNSLNNRIAKKRLN